MSSRFRRWLFLTVGLSCVTLALPGLQSILQLWSDASADSIEWKNLGRGGGGGVVGAAIHPTNPNLILVGSDVGGIYRSANGGVTWSVVNEALVDKTITANYNVRHFAFAPGDPNIVYTSGSHIFRSADAGASWSIRVNLDSSAMVVDANSGDKVYSGVRGKVYRSLDGFATIPAFSCLATGCPEIEIRSLIIHPTDPAQLLACTPSGLFKSADEAQTWNKIERVGGGPPTGLPFNNEACGRLALHSSGSLYMTLKTATPGTSSAWKDPDSWNGGVYKSAPGCSSWGECWMEANGHDDTNLLIVGSYDEGTFENPGDASHPAQGWSYSQATSTTVERICNEPANNGCAIRVTTTASGTAPGIIKSLPVPPSNRGKFHKLTLRARVDSASAVSVFARVFYNDAGGNPVNWPNRYYNWADLIIEQTAAPSPWRKFETIFRVPDSAENMELNLYTFDNAGDTWYDDVTLQVTHALAQVAENGAKPWFLDYDRIVVDPMDENTVYVGTTRGSFTAETGGIWKTTNGGQDWESVTRAQYRDNVLDGRLTAPVCGNRVCEGRWETCDTCAMDCSTSPVGACCGDNNCQTTLNENKDNCRVDCPLPGEPARPYYEVDSYCSGCVPYTPPHTIYGATNTPEYEVWSLAIGNSGTNSAGNPGNKTIVFGGELWKTDDGGTLWQEISADLNILPEPPYESWDPRGDTHYVFAYPVVTDPQDPLRLYYGDEDNFILMSYDGGATFIQDGKGVWRDIGINGEAAMSAVLDPTDHNLLYVGVYSGEWHDPTLQTGGAVYGVFNPATKRWTWSPLGNQANFPKGGAVELVVHPAGPLFAAIAGYGVYKLNGLNGSWSNTYNQNPQSPNWELPPSQWHTFRIIVDPSVTPARLYAGVGDPRATCQPAVSETGVWESTDIGMTWTKITDTESGGLLDREPVTSVARAGTDSQGRDVLLVSTWYAYAVECAPPGTFHADEGGIYRGLRDPVTGTWSFSRVLSQPAAHWIAVSPDDSQIAYAFVGQVCCFGAVAGQEAGIYKTVDRGLTWTLLSNNLSQKSLMNLRSGQLHFKAGAAQPRKLYASTRGNGVFEGTITCGQPSEGFPDFDLDGLANCTDTDDDEDGDLDGTDCAPLDASISHGAVEGAGSLTSCFDGVDNNCDGTTDLDCAANVASGGQSVFTASITCGSVSELGASTANNTYECLREEGAPSARQLHVLWTFATSGVPTGTNYDLRLEGFRNLGANDTFNVSSSKRATGGNCVFGEGGTSTILSVSRTSDQDLLEAADLGTASQAYCVKVVGSKESSDNKQDTLTLDRLFAFPTPVALSDHASTGDIGTVTSGSFVSTQRSDDTREGIQEELSGGSYRLWHTWKFQNVLAGSAHKLHLEGLRTVGAGGKKDDFNFYYSTNPATWSPINPLTGFTQISGAVINSDADPAGGIDSSTFGGTTLSGTVYIRVIDAQKAQTATWRNTLHLDHVAIKTVP